MVRGLTERRFLIRRDGWLQPVLFLVGLTRDSNSYAAIEGGVLRVRFGWFSNQALPLSAIEGVEPGHWPWYGGLGWRSNLMGTIGLVGSLRGVVQIRLRERQRVGVLPFLKLGCNRLALSIEQPEEFVAALKAAIAQ